MKKLTSTLTILGLAVAMTTSTFATVSQPTKYPISLDIIAQMKSTQPYIWDGKFIDAYGNYVEMHDKWEKNIIHKTEQMNSKPNSSKTINGIRPGYKPTKLTLQVNNPQTVTVQPTSTTQVTMGKVVLPDGLPKDSWWIELNADNETEARDVVLKVKEDGTFKFLNLQNGTYEVEIFRGTHADSYIKGASGCFWDKTYTAKLPNLEIKGNINKTFDITKSVVDAVGLSDYFTNTIDYTNPEHYLQITPHLELDDATRQIADEKFNNNKDMTTVKEILKFMLNEYHDFPENAKTDLDITAKEVFKQGYATGCTQFATIFQALCEYKGIPTVAIECVDVDWVKEVNKTQKVNLIAGHDFVEVFVNGKWELVDPTSAHIYENYNPENISIYTVPFDGGKQFYPVAKATDGSAFDLQMLLNTKLTFAKYADISKIDTIVKVDPTERIRK